MSSSSRSRGRRLYGFVRRLACCGGRLSLLLPPKDSLEAFLQLLKRIGGFETERGLGQ